MDVISRERMYEFHYTYLQIAETVAKLSRCNRAKVGAVVVKKGNIVGFGFNGTASGQCNECEEGGVTKPEVIHAETNAILKAGRECHGADLYLTLSPCVECCKLIKQAGIKKVYFREIYRDTTGLNKLGIKFERL